MKNSKGKSAVRQETTNDFLLSEASDILEDRETEVVEQDTAENLVKSPARQMEAAFLEKVLPALEDADQFSALIIEIDPAENRSGKAETRLRIAGVEKSIETFCLEKRGFWGKIDSERFALLLPGSSQAAAIEMSHLLKSRVQAIAAGTVTIGIAVHPTPGFQKRQILANAEKAVVHAKFFGPDSTVPFDAVSLNISGDRYYETGDIDRAVKDFADGLRLNPLDPNLRNSLGVCYGAMGQYDLAQTEFAEAMKLQPEEVMPVYNAGLTAMLRDDREAALVFFDKAARIGGKVFEVALQTGRCLLKMGAPEDALIYLEKAHAERPENGSVHCLMGQCFEKMERYQPAIQALKKAVKINPTDAAALSLLGWAFHRIGENPEIALLFCRKSVEIEPENSLFRQRLGNILQSCGQNETGTIELEKASQLGIDFPEDTNHNVRQKTGTSGT